MSWIDNALGIHPAALALSSQRSEILAANIANSDTPGFKAKDINFHDVLRSQQSNFDLKLSTTNKSHTELSSSSLSGNLQYRVPTKESSPGISGKLRSLNMPIALTTTSASSVPPD